MKRILMCLMVLLAANIFAAESASAQRDTKSVLPKGAWTMSVGPFAFKDASQMPLYVKAVTSEASKGFAVSNIKIIRPSDNEFSKLSIKGFKLKWSLINEDNMSIIQENESKIIDYTMKLSDNRLGIPKSFFLFSNTKLSKERKLTNNFRIDIAVSEVIFEDESNWLINETHRSVSTTNQFGCPDQGCIWNATGNTYQCGGSQSSIGASCSVNGNEGQTCTQTRCKNPNGDEIEMIQGN